MSLSRLGLTLLIGALTMVGVGATEVEDDTISYEARKTMLDMRISEAVLRSYRENTDALLPVTEEPTRLDSLAKEMDPLYRGRVVLRDSWGNRLLYYGREDFFLLLSTGPDGELDREYDNPDLGFHDLLSGDDIILGEGDFIKAPMSTKEMLAMRQNRTMADIRSIGTAIEEFAIDNNVYPAPTGGLVSVDYLSSSLEPTYIRTLPRQDGWGRPIFVWSTGDAYMVVSTGADEVLDASYDGDGRPDALHGKGGFTDPDTDIVFVNGQFVQWPEHAQQ